MVDYQTGTATWDVGMILTRHGNGFTRNPDGTVAACARVIELRRSAQANLAGEAHTPVEERLALALARPCTCGAGDADCERTSVDAPLAN